MMQPLLKAHQRESPVFPLRRPSRVVESARTVLAGKGSLRRAVARPCPLRAVLASQPLRRAAPAGTHPRAPSKLKS